MASSENSYISNAVSSDQYNNGSGDAQAAPPAPAPQGGFLWRMGSGVVNVTKGAVGGTIGLGVGAVKLVGTTSYAVVAKTAEVSKNAGAAAAGKSYDVVAGSVSAVTSRLPSVPLPALKKGKDKKD